MPPSPKWASLNPGSDGLALVLPLPLSFLVNGSHSSWISSSRGVRQGDPISPLLFLIVSQNFYAILNKALSLNLVPGFNSALPRNFNHLMFADDLLLVTRATRAVARNCMLCLNLFHNISGQKTNLKKSALSSFLV